MKPWRKFRLANRSDLAIAEKSGDPDPPESLLHAFGVVVGLYQKVRVCPRPLQLHRQPPYTCDAANCSAARPSNSSMSSIAAAADRR